MTHKAPGKSKRKGITLLNLFEMFPTEEKAKLWFEKLYWDGEVKCPRCNNKKINKLKETRSMPYSCGKCQKSFSIRTGTILQSSKVSLRKWVIAIYLMTTSLKGISSMKLHREIGVTQKTAWLMLQKIRQGFINEKQPPLDGIIEIDETYIGGKEDNKHMKDRIKNKNIERKSIILGMKQREGQIIAKQVPDTKAITLINEIIKSVKTDSKIFTDELKSYFNLYYNFNHKTVNHSQGEYVNYNFSKDKVHTNGIESFWSMFKRGCIGTYHQFSKKHLHRYIAEFAGRFNIRKLDTLAQMESVAFNFIGKKLQYNSLVAGYESI